MNELRRVSFLFDLNLEMYFYENLIQNIKNKNKKFNSAKQADYHDF